MNAGGSSSRYEDIPSPAPSEGDDERKVEKRFKSDEEHDRLKLIDFRQDINARKEYADKLYRLIKWWLVGIGALIICQGITLDFDVPFLPKDYFSISFSLSDQVTITILTGTTINVLGLFLVVARYFYKSNEDIKTPSQNR